uniref:Putative Erf family protein n=1 Tax=viral metagenome TaxID=1070528 RepID=A0A6M3J689_9ZZZZ
MSENQEPYKVTDKRISVPETKDIQLSSSSSPALLMQLALNKGADLDRLEKMLQIQERWEANEARKAYYEALSRFKEHPPELSRSKRVNYTKKDGSVTDYWHADLGVSSEIIDKALGAVGLAKTWKTEQDGNKITVTCTLTHQLGHSESTSLTAEPDLSGNKNSIQGIGSTIFYLERYTLFAITGLAPRGIDDDGMGSEGEPEFITDEQRIEIEQIIVDKGVDPEKFLAYMKVEDVETIPANAYTKAINALKKAKGTKNGNN